MHNFLPISPVSLKECLAQLSSHDTIWLRPTETLYWLIGYHEHITAHQALSLVEQHGLGSRKAYLQLVGGNKPLGIYGQGPDGKGWCLFEIVSHETNDKA